VGIFITRRPKPASFLPVAEAAPRYVGRGFEQQRLHEARQSVNIFFVMRVPLGIAGGKLADLVTGLCRCPNP